MDPRVLVVVGAGPGLGAAGAHRFGAEGYDVALIARSTDRLERLGIGLQQSGVTAGWSAVDIADPEALAAAVTRFGEHLGRIDAVHYNPSIYREADPLQLRPEELLEDLRVGTAGLLTVVQAARPFLRAGSRILATGSMAADRPSPAACSLGVQKAALRNLVHSLDRRLAPEGIRAATLTVNGVLGADTTFSPARIADAMWALASTPEEQWRAEVGYDG